MPVAEPTAVDVLEELETRLAYLTTSEIVFPSRENSDNDTEGKPESPKDSQVVVSVANLTRVADLDLPGNPPRECWELETKLRLRLMPSETDSEAIDWKLMRFVRDVRTAVTGGGTYLDDWFTFDGNALDAEWGDTMERVATDGTSQSDGYVLTLNIRIRVTPGAL